MTPQRTRGLPHRRPGRLGGAEVLNMKKLIGLLFVALILMGGCATMDIGPLETINMEHPGVMEEKNATTGDLFFEREEGVKRNIKDSMLGDFVSIEGTRFDLSIVELNNQKIGLYYAEYAPSVNGWLIKQGFNKRFDYAVADKIIRFKGFEFEILNVENGQIKYRRVK